MSKQNAETKIGEIYNEEGAGNNTQKKVAGAMTAIVGAIPNPASGTTASDEDYVTEKMWAEKNATKADKVNAQGNKVVYAPNGEIPGITTVTSDPRYIIAFVDKEQRFLGGFKRLDGSFYAPRGYTDELMNIINQLKESMPLKAITSDYILVETDKNDVWLRRVTKGGLTEFPKQALLEKEKIKNILFQHRTKNGIDIFHTNFDGSVEFQNLKLSRRNKRELEDEIKSQIRNDYSDQSSFSLHRPNGKVKVFVWGGAYRMTSKSQEVECLIEVLFSDGTYFKKKAIVSIQGSSSAVYPKKNYSIDLLNDDGSSCKISIGGWVFQDSFHLKADYIDATRSRNNVSNDIYEQMLQTLPFERQRPWRKAYNADETALEQRFNTMALAHVDGFPIELYMDGVRWGAYNWNLKKHRDNYMMNKSNTKHIHFELGDNYLFDGNAVQWNNLEIRNPSGFDEGVEPSAGAVKTSIERFINWAGTVTSARFLAEYQNYIDIDSFIEFNLHKILIDAYDCDVKNAQFVTYDGLIWSALPYDLDTTFGLHWTGVSIYHEPDVANDTGYRQNIEKLINDLMKDRLDARYAELRRESVFSVKNIVGLFNERAKLLGFDVLKADLEKWDETPSNRPSATYLRPPYSGGCYTGIGQISNWVERRIPFLDSKYNYNN